MPEQIATPAEVDAEDSEEVSFQVIEELEKHGVSATVRPALRVRFCHFHGRPRVGARHERRT